MLLKLSIENYALIEALEIDFPSGFSVITGETGAGKSILLGALSLILGQRADSSVLLNPERKCIVEGTFRIEGYHLESFFSEHDLDYEPVLIIRREISQSGKSRAFINDTPVNLPLIKELGDKLVNIHSQHAIITLNSADFQLAVLDNYAGTVQEVAHYRDRFSSLQQKRGILAKLIQEQERITGDMDYHQYLLDEIQKADLKPGEQEEIEQRLSILSHAEEIKGNLFRASQALSGEEQAAMHLIAEALHHLEASARFDPELKTLSTRLKEVSIEIKDIAGELVSAGERVYYDPNEMEDLSQRLDLINRLHKKHHTSHLNDLILIMQNIESKIINVDELKEKINKLHNEVQVLEGSLFEAARAISKRRKGSLAGFEKDIIKVFRRLGMEKGRLEVRLDDSKGLTQDGLDRVTFLFSANQGIAPDEISRIASGGELSRVMLSIKSMISQRNLLPTIIFDEIDNGVSGEIAGKVARILMGMAETMQVIAITHLPQIAAKGGSHYKVVKRESGGKTRTGISLLTPDQRIDEIAGMLSSESISKAAIETAKILIES